MKKPKNEVKRTLENLPVKLTQDELNQRAHRITEAVHEIDQNEAEKKAAMRAHKDRDETLQAEVRYLSRIVNSGEEHRPVECEVRPNWENGTMETYRLDSGEMVNFRSMTSAEKQVALDWGSGEDPGPTVN